MANDDKRAEWAEAAQAELDKPMHADKPVRLRTKPTAKDLILFAYDEMAKAVEKPALRAVKK
jgi:hypothetical protein